MIHEAPLIVFEGPDGAGKTTLSRALTDYLCAHGTPCDYFSFPGSEDGSLGRLVHQLHHDPSSFGITRTIDPTALQLLHLAAHIDGLQNRIIPSLAQGRMVILDRFWWSTWVYGLLAGVTESSLNHMLTLEQSHWAGIRPLTVFLLTRDAVPESHSTSTAVEREYLRLAAQAEDNSAIICIRNNRPLDVTVVELARTILRTHSVAHKVSAHRPLSSPGQVLFSFSRIAPAKPTVAYDTYWTFAAERQEIFFKRQTGGQPPWTEDPILRAHKFTNAYRASDRVSQYLLRNVIYSGDQDHREIFFRTLLFKFFNKIDTWEMLKNAFGEVRFSDYRFSHYDSLLRAAIQSGHAIYSAAYIMPSGGRRSPGSKHTMHLMLLEHMMRDDVPQRVAGASSLRDVFDILSSYPTIGPFLAYQYAIDLNYSSFLPFSEMDLVVPGPGARDGIKKCFSDLGGLPEADLIRAVADTQEAEFERRGLPFKTLWGRRLHLVDCQSLFCEVDKYCRLRHPELSGRSGRTRVKQRFRPSRQSIDLWYPPKWNLNDRLPASRSKLHV